MKCGHQGYYQRRLIVSVSFFIGSAHQRLMGREDLGVYWLYLFPAKQSSFWSELPPSKLPISTVAGKPDCGNDRSPKNAKFGFAARAFRTARAAEGRHQRCARAAY